jgi:hypothetical protein
MTAMMGSRATAGAGRFAEERFHARRRAWRRRIWWFFPPFAAVLIAIPVTLGWLLAPEHLGFYWGLGVGVAFAITAALMDSPPHHIERWRQGADGEKATAKALRPLGRDGWTLLHDLDTGRGNIDHLVIGPPGVFLLDTKNLSGALSVKAGVLSVRWREDPDDGYENFRLARQMRARASDLEELVRLRGIEVSVQPVVVLWGHFEQSSLLSKGVAWVQGKELERALRGRPPRLGTDDIERASQAMTDTLARSPEPDRASEPAPASEPQRRVAKADRAVPPRMP